MCLIEKNRKKQLIKREEGGTDVPPLSYGIKKNQLK